MIRHRDRLKILYDILKAINETNGGCLYISCIRNVAHLGTPSYHDRVEGYYNTLIDFGMITVARPQGKREASITNKGKQFILRYERLLKLFAGYNYL